MLRLATSKDIPRLMEMSVAFVKEANMSEISFDEESALETLEQLIEGADGCLVVSEYGKNIVGMAAALKYPHYMNRAQLVAQEMFWWVEPEFRGGMTGARLLRYLEEWARTNGCAMLTMICLPIDGPAEAIYQRSGYRPLERSYIKGL